MIAREEVVTKAQDPVTIQAKLQELELAQAVGAETGALANEAAHLADLPDIGLLEITATNPSASEIRAAEEMAGAGSRVTLRDPVGTRAGGGTSGIRSHQGAIDGVLREIEARATTAIAFRPLPADELRDRLPNRAGEALDPVTGLLKRVAGLDRQPFLGEGSGLLQPLR